jgi:endonuclease YncB( thermonuclease family)
MLHRHQSSATITLTVLAILGAAAFIPSLAPTASARFRPDPAPITCAAASVYIVDGDTIHACGERVRLAAIDAPELPGHCNPRRACTPGDGWASKDNLARLIGANGVTLRPLDRDRYGRLVACASVNGRDLSNAQVAGGFAVERYRRLSGCR